MSKKFPINPTRPESRCWGCDRFCPAHDLQCGNGFERLQHPVETQGKDWYLDPSWGFEIDPDDPTSARFIDPQKANG